MNHRKLLLLLALIAALVVAGCSGDDDGITTPGQQPPTSTGVVRGEIGTGDVAFEFASLVDPDAPNPPPGPFLIRGRDIVYDPEAGVLSVDLTVVNAGENTFPEPVTLTFVELLPEGVTVENADNGETGPGAAILMEFENDDAMWTPGEASLPRTVQFGVEPGVSIGFVARVDVGMLPDGGTIGGLVWHDVDEDGAVDPDEAGLGGFAIRLEAGPDQQWFAMTGPDGSFRFDGLAAGYYAVIRLPRDDARPTTPPQMQVVLVADEDGEVSDFLTADFGVRLVAGPPPGGEIQVGDCVAAKGEFARAPMRLDASHFCPCGPDDDDKDGDCWDRIAGPVTGLSVPRQAVQVMGTWIHVPARIGDLDLEDVAIGQRVRVQVRVEDGPDEPHLVACSLRTFEGHFDRVRGIVQAVRHDEAGRVIGVRVLNTPIAVRDADCDED